MIVRILKESSIDYPGKFGPVIFTSACNFKCGFCHNAILNKLEKLDEDKLIDDLKIKSKSNWYNGVCITGGEPTIYSGLENFIRKLKKLNLDVKLDTNASNPDVLRKLINEKLIDYVAVDIKSDKEHYSEVAQVNVDLQKIEESLKILSSFGVKNFELRTTIPLIKNAGKLRCLNEQEADKMAEWVFSLIPNKELKWVLQEFVSRVKEEVNDESFSLEKLSKDLQKTPQSVLENLQKVISKYFPNCRIR